MISALTRTTPHGCCLRTAPCWPGALGWTSLRSSPESAKGLQVHDRPGKSCFFSCLCTSGEAVLGEAQSIALSVRDKRDPGVHLIYYFSNFYYLFLILCHSCESSCGLNAPYLLCPSLSGLIGTMITQTMAASTTNGISYRFMVWSLTLLIRKLIRGCVTYSRWSQGSNPGPNGSHWCT